MLWRGLGLSLRASEASVSTGLVPVRHCCRINLETVSARVEPLSRSLGGFVLLQGGVNLIGNSEQVRLQAQEVSSARDRLSSPTPGLASATGMTARPGKLRQKAPRSLPALPSALSERKAKRSREVRVSLVSPFPSHSPASLSGTQAASSLHNHTG